MNCPICGYEQCDEFIVDLFICNACSHVFKKEPIIQEILLSELHKFKSPVDDMRKLIEKKPNGYKIEFEFPTMMFYGLEAQPSAFYNNNINHYFNQRSLMVFLNRCGLKIEDQHNRWYGKICLTNIKVVKVE